MKARGGLVVACVLAVVAVAPAVPQQRVAQAGAAPFPVAAPASPAPTTAGSARCADGTSAAKAGGCEGPQLRLLYGNRLPLWHLGKPYGPVELVRGGRPPYTIEWLRDGKPPGLDFDATKGTLFSVEVATEAKPRWFTIEVTDRAEPPQKVRQTFELVVGRPPPEPAAGAGAGSPLLDEAEPGTAQVFRLTETDIADIARRLAVPVEGEQDPSPKPCAPPTAPSDPEPPRVCALLLPLQDIEFPSRRLFDSALRAQHCAIAAREPSQPKAQPPKTPPLTCDVRAVHDGGLPDLRADASAAERRRFNDVLPPSTRELVVEKARKAYRLAGTDRIRLEPPGRFECGCAPRPSSGKDIVFGFLPRWHQRLQPPTIDFSLLHRLGVIGPRLDDHGVLAMPDKWNEDVDALSRLAARYDTRLDVVLYRADWRSILDKGEDQRAAMATKGARELVQVIDAESKHMEHEFRPPYWRGADSHVFSGITLYFGNAPATTAGDLGRRFPKFFNDFMDALVSRLQEGKDKERPITLSIVVPGEQFGIASPYTFPELMNWVQTAQRTDNPLNQPGSDVRYVGTHNITVRVLVQIHERTADFKKIIRQRLDQSEDLKGHRRVALLSSIVPMLFLPQPGTPVPSLSGGTPVMAAEPAASAPAAPQRLSPAAHQQLDDDLSYYRWNFSGSVALWSLPVRSEGAGSEILQLLRENWSEMRPQGWICTTVCTERGGVRLAAQVLSLVTLGMFLAYHWVASVRRLGRPMWWVIVIVFVFFALPLWLALLSCDPSLAQVRDGNKILIALLATAAVVLLWFSAKKRVPVP